MSRKLWISSLILFILAPSLFGDERPAPLTPLVRTIDLNVGESTQVTLADGKSVRVKLVELVEHRDDVCDAVRRAEVTVDVDGETATLVSANYHLPRAVGPVQIDCTITKGYNKNGRVGSWGLDKDARLRLWPAQSPLLRPGTFRYPIRQK